MAKVLIIEDDDVIARGVARHLETAGFDAVGVANGETGLARLRYERPNACALVLTRRASDGRRVTGQAAEEGSGTPTMAVAARGREPGRLRHRALGAPH